MSENLSLAVDTSAGHEALDVLEKRIQDVVKTENQIVGTTEKAAKLSFNRVLSSARMAWSAVDQVFQAMGVNMGEQMRLLIQSGFSAITALRALYSAQATNPYTSAFGLFSLAELGFAVVAFTQFQLGQQEAATQTAKTARALYATGNFINSISFM